MQETEVVGGEWQERELVLESFRVGDFGDVASKVPRVESLSSILEVHSRGVTTAGVEAGDTEERR